MLKNPLNIGLITIAVFLIAAIFVILQKFKVIPFYNPSQKVWDIQSIDTVKYSRDLAKERMNDQAFDSVIDDQVKKISETGATHIALGTPYDKEFIPFMSRWVNSARKYNLKVWFRGNFSGWEHWFNYKPISREEHKELLKNFILNNEALFEDGDIFTSCTECENGGPGDPRKTGDVNGYRQFLIEEYIIGKEAMDSIDKDVSTNYFPMNYDVASLIMDKETTKSLDGIVVIDHYVKTPEQTNMDSTVLAANSGGKIVIGEFGAPIPDIHGQFSEQEQADWIEKTLLLLSQNENVIGINYWTAVGGSTQIWKVNGDKTLSVDVLKRFFSPTFIKGYIIDEAGNPIKEATIRGVLEKTVTNSSGQFSFAHLESGSKVVILAPGYYHVEAQNLPSDKTVKIILRAKEPSFTYNLQKMLFRGIIHL